ncbi:MAG TPA: winged helix-turn-helix domain-containing protein [Nitrolancea sp.]|nr:winged helix-turn-helix domain-containing protein [Nitrolancea sp.]
MPPLTPDVPAQADGAGAAFPHGGDEPPHSIADGAPLATAAETPRVPGAASTAVADQLAVPIRSQVAAMANGVASVHETASSHRPAANTPEGAGTPGSVPSGTALTLDRLTADSLALPPAQDWAVTTPLAIQCFGAFRVRAGETMLAPRRHHKAWELLQLLAAHPPRSLTRDRLIVALWPDPEALLNRNVVNALVGRLREELVAQVPGLAREVVRQARNGDCWLDLDLVTVDVHQWLAIVDREPRLPLAAALAECRQAHALYRPGLLAGASFEWLYPRDEDGLDLAEDYHDTWRRYVLRLARRCVREERADLAIPLYRCLRDAHPRDEAIARELYRCYGRTGDLPGLEREARLLAAALRQEYGDEEDSEALPDLDGPAPETRELFEQIRRQLQAYSQARTGHPDIGVAAQHHSAGG